MDGLSYSLKIDGAAYRALDIRVTMANRRPTQITVTDLMFADGYVLADTDDPGQFAKVEIEFAGLRFVCSYTVFDAHRAGPGWTNTLECRPAGLFILANCDYFQEWFSHVSADEDPVVVRSGFVVLNQRLETLAQNQVVAAKSMTVAEQLRDIFNAAATLAQECPGDFLARVPRLNFEGSVGALTLPPNEDRNLTMHAAILKTLQMFPGVIVRDAHGDGDTVDILQNPGPWEKPPSKFIEDRFRRDSTGIDRVDIEFVSTGDTGGVLANTITHDVAERPDAPKPVSPARTLTGTLMFTGASQNRTRNGIDIETMDVPPSLYDLGFWKKIAPEFFDAPDITGIKVHGCVREGERDGTAEDYPRICVNTALPQIVEAGIEVKARVERFSCLADITRKNAQNEKVDSQCEVPFGVELVTTDAVTKRYEWTESFDYESADPLPFGIARQILDAYPSTGARVVRFYLNDPGAPVPPLVGETFKGLPCQRCAFSLRSMECEADFTPSPEQSLEDRAKLITGFRGRVQARWNRKTRETGKPDTGSNVNRNTAQPLKTAYVTGQGERKMALYTGEDETDKRIRVAPDDIATENKNAKMRTVSYAVVGADGKPETRTASFMATAPEGEPDDEKPKPPPPCGHPGNNPGGGNGPDENGNDEDHPGNDESGGLGPSEHPGGPGGQDGPGGPDDHPGNKPSPPCKS